MDAWLAQWTPVEIRTTLTYIGLPAISVIGLLAVAYRHGWPWQRKK